MLHPRLTSLDGLNSQWLASIGPTGSFGDLGLTTRWGDGASGMFEIKWTMPLPPDFEHPLLRRGTRVELMDGSVRIGSPLILSEPARGTGYDDPWEFVATGVGREVEGENSFFALDSGGNSTTIASVAVDQAIGRGLYWGGRDATSVPTTAFGTSSTTEELNTIGALLSAIGSYQNKRWLVGQDGIVRLSSDPTTPSYQVVPGAAALGTADDDYATVVLLRFIDSATGLYTTVAAPSSTSPLEQRFGRREFPVDVSDQGAITAATASAWANGILARTKGRLAWTNKLELTSGQVLTMGGVPAELSKLAEDVGDGCIVRLHGIWNDLLDFNGQTYLDILMGQAEYTDGEQTISLSPINLAARDLASIVEEVTGHAA